ETEEAASAPVDAGDGASECGEAPKYPPVPLKALGRHRNAVEDTGVLADQHRATSDRLELWKPLGDGACLRFSAGLGLLTHVANRRGNDGAGARTNVADLDDLLAPSQDARHQRR